MNGHSKIASLALIILMVACRSNSSVCKKANELHEKAGETERTSTMVGEKAINKCIDDLTKEETEHPAKTDCRKRCITNASTLEEANRCANDC